MSDSGGEGSGTSGFEVSPRLAGIVVVAGVIFLPGIPVGYLTPLAVFLGAVTVFVMEGRKYRQQAAGNRSVGKARSVAASPQSVDTTVVAKETAREKMVR